MKILVQKFGGSSLRDRHCIERAAGIIAGARQEGMAVVAVASAMGDTTDKLLALANQFDGSKCGRELDMLLATGEQASASLLAMAVTKGGHGAVSFTGGQAGMQTDRFFGAATIMKVRTDAIQRVLKEGKVAVVAGYQGLCGGEITTLGRGGSDTTAVALAQALGAQYCDIYTDVDGVYSCDPRYLNTPKKLENLSFAQMLAMSRGGARVMSASAMNLALRANVPVRVRSSINTRDQGTLIGGKEFDLDFCGIALDSCGVFLVKPADSLSELAAVQKMLRQLSECGVAVEVVHRLAGKFKNSPGKIHLAVSRTHLHNSEKLVGELASGLSLNVTYLHNLTKISLVGNFARPEIACQKAVSSLLAHGICPIYWSQDQMRVAALLSPMAVRKSVAVLHESFAMPKPPFLLEPGYILNSGSDASQISGVA